MKKTTLTALILTALLSIAASFAASVVSIPASWVNVTPEYKAAVVAAISQGKREFSARTYPRALFVIEAGRKAGLTAQYTQVGMFHRVYLVGN